jgi:hypothetical protein
MTREISEQRPAASSQVAGHEFSLSEYVRNFFPPRIVDLFFVTLARLQES